MDNELGAGSVGKGDDPLAVLLAVLGDVDLDELAVSTVSAGDDGDLVDDGIVGEDGSDIGRENIRPSRAVDHRAPVGDHDHARKLERTIGLGLVKGDGVERLDAIGAVDLDDDAEILAVLEHLGDDLDLSLLLQLIRRHTRVHLGSVVTATRGDVHGVDLHVLAGKLDGISQADEVGEGGESDILLVGGHC